MKKTKLFQNEDASLICIKNVWESLFNSLHKFSDDFMHNRKQPKQQDRSYIF